MTIKPIPTNFRVYYKSMTDATTQKREIAVEAKEELEAEVLDLFKAVTANLSVYKEQFNVDLTKYEEFMLNKYSTGTFLKVAKGMFVNRSNNYEAVSDLFDAFKLATKQKELYNVTKDIQLYDKLLNLSLKEYTNILKIYFNEVHKKMILEGCGYSFGKSIGWTCINRCKLVKNRPHIDFIATRRREAELKAQGKKIYNKEEAEWCKTHGIEYVAEDKRVFKNNEYCYEIPLLASTLPNAYSLALKTPNYVSRKYAGMTYDDMVKYANFDKVAICNMDIDIRKKLALCEKVDKMLYTKFIRNENQQPITTPKARRKN